MLGLGRPARSGQAGEDADTERGRRAPRSSTVVVASAPAEGPGRGARRRDTKGAKTDTASTAATRAPAPESPPSSSAPSPGSDRPRLLVRQGDAEAWIEVDGAVAAPSGRTLTLRFELSAEHYVVWRGAREVGMTYCSSTAELVPAEPGALQVEVQAFDAAGRSLHAGSIHIEVFEGPTEDLAAA